MMYSLPNVFKWILTLNTYWTRPSPTSSLLRPDKVILGEANIVPKKTSSNKLHNFAE